MTDFSTTWTKFVFRVLKNIARRGQNPTSAKELAEVSSEGYIQLDLVIYTATWRGNRSFRCKSFQCELKKYNYNQAKDVKLFTRRLDQLVSKRPVTLDSVTRHFISLRLYGVEKWTLNKHIMSHKIRCPISVDMLLPIWYPSSNMSRGAQ